MVRPKPAARNGLPVLGDGHFLAALDPLDQRGKPRFSLIDSDSVHDDIPLD